MHCPSKLRSNFVYPDVTWSQIEAGVHVFFGVIIPSAHTEGGTQSCSSPTPTAAEGLAVRAQFHSCCQEPSPGCAPSDSTSLLEDFSFLLYLGCQCHCSAASRFVCLRCAHRKTRQDSHPARDFSLRVVT